MYRKVNICVSMDMGLHLTSQTLICPPPQARVYLSPEEVLKGDVSESLRKVQTSLDILNTFRLTYEEKRASLGQYQRKGREVRPWDFHPLMVFSGLDRFMDRVKTIEVRINSLKTGLTLKN
jgi:hypothetical protein